LLIGTLLQCRQFLRFCLRQALSCLLGNQLPSPAILMRPRASVAISPPQRIK
jgi:hypothetical protein